MGLHGSESAHTRLNKVRVESSWCRALLRQTWMVTLNVNVESRPQGKCVKQNLTLKLRFSVSCMDQLLCEENPDYTVRVDATWGKTSQPGSNWLVVPSLHHLCEALLSEPLCDLHDMSNTGSTWVQASLKSNTWNRLGDDDNSHLSSLGCGRFSSARMESSSWTCWVFLPLWGC